MKYRNTMIGARLIDADKKALRVYEQGAELMCLAQDHILYHMSHEQIARISNKFNKIKNMQDSNRGIVSMKDSDTKVLRVIGTLRRIIKEYIKANGMVPKETVFNIYSNDKRTLRITRKEFEFILKQIEEYVQSRRRYNGTRCTVLVKA